jgi:DNA invertase Pin-like site-specific DNA recombinase
MAKISKVCKQCSSDYIGYKQSRYCSSKCFKKARTEQRKNNVRIYKRFVWEKEFYPILAAMLNNGSTIEEIAKSFDCTVHTVKLKINKLEVTYKWKGLK